MVAAAPDRGGGDGLSDREAVDRITFDLRWKYAAGGLAFDYAGFVHTVLLLRIVDEKLNSELSSCCKRDDDYIAPGKPSCDWDDVAAREALVDALARGAYAILAALDGRTLASEVTQAAKLVATVVGQDLEQRGDGMFRIARRVAKDRVISTEDPEAVTVTRQPLVASTATKGTSLSTRTPRSSPRPP